MAKRVIVTGASGMIGGIVLRHCLASGEITQVISLVRTAGTVRHPKLKEIIHRDFSNYNGLESEFTGIDIAYFCLGVYTGSVPDALFKEITVDYTHAFAEQLKVHSPGATFCFLSGAGADPNEQSRLAFARYKGMAENGLIRQNFGSLTIFRPGYIYPVEKRKEPNVGYRVFRFLYPLIRLFSSNMGIKSTELGKAIFLAGLHTPGKMILENKDILHFLDTSPVPVQPG